MGGLGRQLWAWANEPWLTAVGFVIVAVRYSLLTVLTTATFAVCVVLQIFWRATLGKAFRFIGGLAIVGQHPLGAFRDADAAVEAYLARGIAWSEKGLVYSLNQLVDTFAILIAVPVLIAQGLAELVPWVRAQLLKRPTRRETHDSTSKVQRAVTTLSRSTKAQLVTLRAKVTVLERRAGGVPAVSPAPRPKPKPAPQPKPKTRPQPTIVKVPQLKPELQQLQRTQKAQGKRIGRLEKIKLAPVAIVAAALASTKLGLGWLRCRNVQKAGKRVCGMDNDLLDTLLAGSLLLIGAQSLDQLARELDGPTGVVMDSMGLLVTEVRDTFAAIPR